MKQGGSVKDRLDNWEYLNRFALKRVGMQVSKSDIEQIITNGADVVERVLKVLKDKLTKSSKKRERPRTGDILASPDFRQLVASKDKTIAELKDTLAILEAKVGKMEQLIVLKDSKIDKLLKKLELSGLI